MDEQNLKKTPLYDLHIQHGGKLVPFAGYWLPVQYEAGVIREHQAVRQEAGLFDVSHMGEVSFNGPDALANIQNLLCNDFTSLQDGRVRYSPMLNPQGGVVDDVLVYRVSDSSYLMVVNAANKDKDFAWIKQNEFGNVKIEDLSDGIAQLALQGPRAEEMMRALLPEESIPQKYYSFLRNVKLRGMDCLVSRTGYTGEDGFEIYLDGKDAPKLFELLVETGKAYGLQLCGLGCRDTLRMEAAMPLYGHEMDDAVLPTETGLGNYVKMQKPAFIGREALAAAGEPKRARVGIKMVGRGIAREHFPVYHGDKLIGMTTSGTHSPTLGYPVAMALVETPYAGVGDSVLVEIRGKKVEGEIVPLPFYKRAK